MCRLGGWIHILVIPLHQHSGSANLPYVSLSAMFLSPTLPYARDLDITTICIFNPIFTWFFFQTLLPRKGGEDGIDLIILNQTVMGTINSRLYEILHDSHRIFFVYNEFSHKRHKNYRFLKNRWDFKILIAPCPLVSVDDVNL